jgi:sulfane dehydrogenase subunit SoxC
MNPNGRDRRRFLKEGAALVGVAVGAIPYAGGRSPAPEPPPEGRWPSYFKDTRAYGERSHFDTVSRWPIRPQIVTPQTPLYTVSAPRTPLEDIKGIITPNPLHYYTDAAAAYPLPDIDPQKWRLVIHGLVDHPMMLNLEELQRLPSVSRICWLECTGNSGPRARNFPEFHETAGKTHGNTACAEWTGVLLSLILKECGIQKGASWVYVEGGEIARRAKTFQLEKATDDVIVAYAQNGEAIHPENGYPVRLIVPGWAGHNSTKWLRRIKLVDRPQMAKDDLGFRTGPDGKWIGEREFDPKSLILYPSGGQRLSGGAGPYEIRGLAWTGAGVIRRVEVTTDGGRTWKDAKLQEPILSKAYTRFVFPWNWNEEETVIESRCTDEASRTQMLLSDIRKEWGDNPDNWRSSEAPGERFSGTQPWKILRDGSVHQAAFGPHMTPPAAPGTAASAAFPFNFSGKDSSCFG